MLARPGIIGRQGGSVAFPESALVDWLGQPLEGGSWRSSFSRAEALSLRNFLRDNPTAIYLPRPDRARVQPNGSGGAPGIGAGAGFLANNGSLGTAGRSIDAAQTPVMLTNPSFDSGSTGWIAQNATLDTSTAGQIDVTGTSSGVFGIARQPFASVANAWYEVIVDCEPLAGSCFVGAWTGAAVASTVFSGGGRQIQRCIFQAANTSAEVRVGATNLNNSLRVYGVSFNLIAGSGHLTAPSTAGSPILQGVASPLATLGPELVANGGFDADIAGWIVETGSVVWNAGRLSLTDQGIGGQARLPISTVAGRLYRVRLEVVSCPQQLVFCAGANSSAGKSNDLNVTVGFPPAPGFYEYVWRSTFTNGAIGFISAPTGNTALVDNVSVREIAESDLRYWFRPDGADDWLRGGPALGSDFWHVGGWRRTVSNWAFGTSNAAPTGAAIETARHSVRNAANTGVIALTSFTTANDHIFSFQRQSGSAQGWANGVSLGLTTDVVPISGTDALVLYGSVNNVSGSGVAGRNYASLFGTGVLPASIRLLAERAVGRLTGVAL